MRKLLLLAICGCIGFTAAGQELEEINDRVNFGIGAAFAVGDFKNTDYRNETAGFARTGRISAYSYAVNVTKNFGIGWSVAGRANTMNQEKMLQAHNMRKYGRAEMTAIESRSPWGSAFLLTDLYLQQDLDKIVLYAKGSVGMTYNKYAGNWFGEYYPAGSNNMVKRDLMASERGLGAVAPAFGLAAGLQYNIGQFGLGFETGYLATKPEYKLTDGMVDTKLRQPMNSLHTSVSVSFRGIVRQNAKPFAEQESATDKISHRVAVQYGVAIPFGDFKNNVLYDQQSAFAKRGTYASLGYIADLHRNVGLGATLGWRRNEFDLDEFSGYLLGMHWPSTVVSQETGSWNSHLLLGDLYFKTPLGPIVFYTKCSYGASVNSSPALAVTLQNQSDLKFTEVEWKSSRNIKPAFGYAWGIYHEPGRVGVGLEAGVLQLKSKSRLMYNTPPGGNSLSLHSFNASLGIHYRI